MITLLIATGNQGKLAEFTEHLKDIGIRLLSLADFPGMPEIEENGATFLENAFTKARAACAYSGLPALADDSGLMVDALGGEPGVRSARFAPTTPERNAKLLDLLHDVPDERRTARFVCALALVRPDGFEWTTLGTVGGEILDAPSGAGGFGYDPIFLYPPLGMTFAEIPLEEKNKISHRGRALEEFRRAVIEENILK
ncbi:MAG: RdgB/HAM1 family non-canonical purine NTP pyrophosphatase [Candidatus Latescibacterota bacterium]